MAIDDSILTQEQINEIARRFPEYYFQVLMPRLQNQMRSARSRSRWPAELTREFVKLYPTMPNRQLAKKLGLTYSQVKNRARNLKLKKSHNTRIYNELWTPERVKLLKDLYATTRNADLAKKLGLKQSQIEHKAFKLGLKTDPELLRQWSKEGCFKPGHVPANKGKKMSAERYERCKHTMFQKGGKPANTLHNGAITIRHRKHTNEPPYKFIRIGARKWIYLHVHVWKSHHGDVPDGHVIRFIDGNTLNCDIDNLQCITLAENMELNRYCDKAVATYMAKKPGGKGLIDKEYRDELLDHPELLQIKRQQLLLNRSIKDNERSRKQTT